MLRLKGICMIIFGSVLWGATGPLIEWLLGHSAITVSFLLTIRLTVAGIVLLVFLFSRKVDLFTVWKTAHWRNQLLAFSILGMLGVQFTFVAAIDASNAVVATLLQFSAPIFVALYVSFSYKKFPPRYQVIGIIGTLVGLFFLLTNGSLSGLLISKEALIWGGALGLSFAFYTLYPARLMKEWNLLMIVGWAMIIGGIILGSTNQIWRSTEWVLLAQPLVTFSILLIILFGTTAFILFLNSMNYISAVETSILSTVEPLTAMIISVIWFGTVLHSIQLIGVLLMILFVTWLSIGGTKVTIEEKVKHYS